ncbi:ABC-F family ATP-binding cassette domain-containing protein [Brevibacterium litoralis]|uniref:ABC-F family ATP-binding cassette domain-containing protein n=1 Tax=Brevibacterium litoralis TaxID=3138935 RepID=UPI0032ED9F8E
MAPTHLLGSQTISLSYPNRTVLADVTVGLAAGDRIGMVGRNGDGKSTLMRILAGSLEPDSGRVTSRGGTRIGYLEQTDVLDGDLTVRQSVVGDVPDHEWASRAEVRDVMTGLLGDLDLEETVGGLSGGQRRRVALARLLAGDWDVLMLDEPTNHLDIEGVRWLAQHVKKRWPVGQGALLVVTHDRWFLDEVTTLTWEVHDGTVDVFEGGYAAYVLQRVERDRQAAVEWTKQKNLMRKELAWLRRGAPARTSKPKFRVDAANELISGEPPVRDTVELVKTATSRLGKDVFELTDVAVQYPGTPAPAIEDVTWIIGPGDRFGILGPNGAGKSTVVKTLTGEVTPTVGRIKRGKTVRVAVLDQQLRELDGLAEDRVRELLDRKKASYSTDAGDLAPSQLLEKLGLGGVLQSRVKDLSGGQQRRLQLLLILLDEPNVLILDEPTNDMDTDMLAAMEDLLDSWPGTLLVISHDRYFMERVTDHQFALLDHHVRHLPGGVDEYLRAAADRERVKGLPTGSSATAAGAADATAVEAPATSGAPGAGASGAGESGAGTGLSAAEERQLRKQAQGLTRKIEKVEKKLAALDERMAAADPSDFTGLADLSAERGALTDEKDELEMEWLDVSERLEG